jgi:hypothetical protein
MTIVSNQWPVLCGFDYIQMGYRTPLVFSILALLDQSKEDEHPPPLPHPCTYLELLSTSIFFRHATNPFQDLNECTTFFVPISSLSVPIQTVVTLPLNISLFLSGFNWPISDQIFHVRFALIAACFGLFILWPWIWRQHVPLKH